MCNGKKNDKIDGTSNRLMEDTDIKIVTKQGIITVIYPTRIGREYETPWLKAKEGSREWNISPFETLLYKNSYQNGRLIIGEWGTAYKEMKGVKHIIPLDSIVRFESLSENESQVALDNRKKEQEQVEINKRANRVICGYEFDDLSLRVQLLEKIIKSMTRKES